MRARSFWLGGLGLLICGAPVALMAQASGLPTGTPPFRTSRINEFSLMFVVPSGVTWGGEMTYTIPVGPFDVGGRFSVVDPDGAGDPNLNGEIQARLGVSSPTRDYPVHSAVTASVGTGSTPAAGRFGAASAGYQIGRRIVVSPEVAVVPYGGPTFIVRTGDAERVAFMFGLGADLWIGPRFSTRLALGFGHVEGYALGFVWRQ